METTFPFGKHKGKRLSEIPDDYFAWLRREGVQLNPWLADAVAGEISRREKERRRGQSSFDEDGAYTWSGFDETQGYTRKNRDGSYSHYYNFKGNGNGYDAGGYHAPGKVPSSVDQETAIEIVEAGRRALARKYHPDAGGTNEAMSRINAISDWLEDYLKTILPAGSNR